MSAESKPQGRHQRATVEALRARPKAQVLVIGGGINGIATFRDLALQNVDVALVERADYVSGASSASSHMIHGGIRYLENGEFRLVRESVQERNGLLRIAPHYVRPLRTTVPIYSAFSGIVSAPLRFLTHKQQGKPTERGALLIKVGLVLYDSFSRDGGRVPRHEFRGKVKSHRDLPQLDPRVRYTATYYDAAMHDPERLALDVLHDGIAASETARAANYLEAVGTTDGGVILRDAVTGEEFAFDADVIVNASGPWTDRTNTALGESTRFMGGTKGSHIVLDNPALLEATAGREIFFEHEDGRIVLIYPLKGRVLVGTTDLPHDMNDPIRCTPEEVQYFFDLIKHVFPAIAVDESQIVYRFSGVRPLPRADDTKAGLISRDYRVEERRLAGPSSPVVLSLVGGKWTTFRALGEQLGDRVLELLGSPRSRSTLGLPIGGGIGFPTDAATRSRWIAANRGWLSSDRADALLTRYGTRATELIATLTPESDVPLRGAPDYTVGEVQHLIRTEEVVHLLDLVLRRTSMAFVGQVTDDLIDELLDLLATERGLTDEERAGERADAVASLVTDHGIPLTQREPVAAALPERTAS